MRNRRLTCEMLAKSCGKPLDVVEKDASRKRYFSPEVRVYFCLLFVVHAFLLVWFDWGWVGGSLTCD